MAEGKERFFSTAHSRDALPSRRGYFAPDDAIRRHRRHDSNFFAYDIETGQSDLLRQPLLNVLTHLIFFSPALGAPRLAHDEKFSVGTEHSS